jgi:hypothetical protein
MRQPFIHEEKSHGMHCTATECWVHSRASLDILVGGGGDPVSARKPSHHVHQGCTNPGCQVAMVALNFEVASRFLENLCTPDIH